MHLSIVQGSCLTEKSRKAKPLVVDLYNLIKSRRTIHLYKQELVSKDILEQALELALYAPNHKLSFPWIFIEVGKSAREKLADLSVHLKCEASGEAASTTILQAARRKFLEPAYLILVGIKKSNDMERQKEDYATLACSLQNIALFLWDKGIGTKWSTGKVTTSPLAYELAGIKASEYELCGFLWVGVPAKIPDTPERPPVSQFFKQID